MTSLGHSDKDTEQKYSKGPRQVEIILPKQNLLSGFTTCIQTWSNWGISPDILLRAGPAVLQLQELILVCIC